MTLQLFVECSSFSAFSNTDITIEVHVQIVYITVPHRATRSQVYIAEAFGGTGCYWGRGGAFSLVWKRLRHRYKNVERPSYISDCQMYKKCLKL